METLILSVLISFAAAVAGGYFAIPLLRSLKAGQPIRKLGPESHYKKAGTPTMGGIIMVFGVVVTCIIFHKRLFTHSYVSIAAALAFGLMGGLDDLLKLLRHNSDGLRAYQKIIFQFVFSVLIAIFAYKNPAIGSSLYVPFFGIEWDLGIWYIPFTVFTITALTNGVNLCDGLDGLCAGVTMIVSAAFTVIFFSLKTVIGENMLVFAAAMTGACLGFLRFNSYPARVFMGDLGAFFLGGGIAMMFVVSRLQLMILIMGIIYTVSDLSVVLQVGSYKLRHGKRIFLMAPLHHHFEKKGIPETKIVSTYMLVTAAACLIGLLGVL